MVIDGLQFARSRCELNGVVVPEQLSRLVQMGCETSGISFKLNGGVNECGKPALHLRLAGTLDLVCQRCLLPMQMLIQTEVNLELSRNREEIESADDEVDRVVAARKMNVADLVEDEVLLFLPMIPRHEQCEATPEMVAAVAQEFEPTKSVSAFGALALLGKPGGKR